MKAPEAGEAPREVEGCEVGARAELAAVVAPTDSAADERVMEAAGDLVAPLEWVDGREAVAVGRAAALKAETRAVAALAVVLVAYSAQVEGNEGAGALASARVAVVTAVEAVDAMGPETAGKVGAAATALAKAVAMAQEAVGLVAVEATVVHTGEATRAATPAAAEILVVAREVSTVGEVTEETLEVAKLVAMVAAAGVASLEVGEEMAVLTGEVAVGRVGVAWDLVGAEVRVLGMEPAV